MFGFGKSNKEYDVRLTEKQMQELTKNMTKHERKEFEKRQKINKHHKWCSHGLFGEE